MLAGQYAGYIVLQLELFRSGTYTGANLVVLLVALAMFGVTGGELARLYQILDRIW